ncbi:MAG: TrkA family potassium uptake protein [Candidatus Nanopelagicales bacterium]|nr:TrkA family potassium uptake protein [Candidatus Nanopelagicales bacterium]
MHVVIMGCGRVGSALSLRLIELGHSVAIIDKDESAFVAVGNDFTGQKVLGVGFDRDTLIEAGIEKAQAFAAVSSGDNSNIVSARVARENFNVPLVVARIYDPRRAKVYERLGIPTVASVAWTTDQVLRRLLPLGAQEEWRDPSGNVVLAQVYLSPKWIGKKVGELAEVSKSRIALISRFGGAILPDRETILQEGDLIHAIYKVQDKDLVENVFSSGPKD